MYTRQQEEMKLLQMKPAEEQNQQTEASIFLSQASIPSIQPKEHNFSSLITPMMPPEAPRPSKSRKNKLHRLKYSCEEIYERMDNGLCIFCDELDTPNHQNSKHKGVQILMVDCVDDQLDVEESVEESMDKSPTILNVEAAAKNVKDKVFEDDKNSSMDLLNLATTGLIREEVPSLEKESKLVQVLHQIEVNAYAQKLTGINTHYIAHQLFDRMLRVHKESSEEAVTFLGIYENNKMFDLSGQANHVWEPGGVFNEHDKWKGLEKCYNHGTLMRLMQQLFSVWCQGVKSKESDRCVLSNGVVAEQSVVKSLEKLPIISVNASNGSTTFNAKDTVVSNMPPDFLIQRQKIGSSIFQTQQTNFHVWHRWRNKAETVHTVSEFRPRGIVFNAESKKKLDTEDGINKAFRKLLVFFSVHHLEIKELLWFKKLHEMSSQINPEIFIPLMEETRDWIMNSGLKIKVFSDFDLQALIGLEIYGYENKKHMLLLIKLANRVWECGGLLATHVWWKWLENCYERNRALTCCFQLEMSFVGYVEFKAYIKELLVAGLRQFNLAGMKFHLKHKWRTKRWQSFSGLEFNMSNNCALIRLNMVLALEVFWLILLTFNMFRGSYVPHNKNQTSQKLISVWECLLRLSHSNPCMLVVEKNDTEVDVSCCCGSHCGLDFIANTYVDELKIFVDVYVLSLLAAHRFLHVIVNCRRTIISCHALNETHELMMKQSLPQVFMQKQDGDGGFFGYMLVATYSYFDTTIEIPDKELAKHHNICVLTVLIQWKEHPPDYFQRISMELLILEDKDVLKKGVLLQDKLL